MAKTPTARPTADGVDPITPQPQDNGDGVTKTQDPETLAQTTDVEGETAPAPTQNEQSPVLTKEDDPKALPGNGATVEVEMVKVKTKGAYILMDPFSGYHVDEKGNDVPVTSFINDELAEGGRLEKA